MNIKLSFIKTNNRTEIKRSYSKDDLSLDVRINYLSINKNAIGNSLERNLGVKERSFVLFIGTLSLCFSGDDLNLTSIDAYSNYKSWEKLL